MSLSLGLSAASLVTATLEVTRALNEYNRSAQLEATVRFELEVAEAQAITAGLEGKNEAERKAHLRLQLSDQHTALQGTEAGTRDARRDLDVARAALDCLRFQLRLLEAGRGSGRMSAVRPLEPMLTQLKTGLDTATALFQARADLLLTVALLRTAGKSEKAAALAG